LIVLKRGIAGISFFVLTFGFIFSPVSTSAQVRPVQQQTISKPYFELNRELRKLWIDHTIWTGSYIMSAIAGLPEQQKVLERLLKNQDDIGNAYKPYYGEAAGNKVAALLREHIIIAGQLVEAAKTGNQPAAAKLNRQWHRNADDIARYLSKANPYWNENVLKDMLYTHLKLINDQVVFRLKKDAEIKAVDVNEEHMLHFADILSGGIAKQFPKKF
jgi:hypothetical protein